MGKVINDEFIQELFNNEYFLYTLNNYIAKNLKLRQDYDVYEGKYDDLQVDFAGINIEVESDSYGY